jgi:hypothetical protein
MEYFTLIPLTTDTTYLIAKFAVLLVVLVVWMIVMSHPAF